MNSVQIRGNHMSRSDQFDNFSNEQENPDVSSDTYNLESSVDIYDSPDIIDVTPESGGGDEASAAETENAGVTGTHGAGEYGVSPYGVQPSPENNQENAGNPYTAPYGNGQYGGNPYNDQYGNHPYGSGQYGNNQYGNNPYGNGQYGNNQYGNGQYGNNQYGNNPYGNGQYGNSQYGNGQYGNNQYGNNPYGNGQYGNNQYGNNPYANSQYSPFAAPPRKNKSGLIIGIVVAVIVLFLIAVFALVYKAMDLYTQNARNAGSSRDEYNFDDDDWGTDHHDYDYNDDGYDYDYDYNGDGYDDYDYDYDDDWYNNYDYDDYEGDSPYYEFHNEIRDDLSYSVELEDEDYEPRNDNVDMEFTYPVISGRDVPNLDKLNEAIRSEIDAYIDFYEQEYAETVGDDEYYQCRIVPYVTYMDEDKLSIVLDERINSAYYTEVYLYCINIDMEHGVVMDNGNILSIDDDFSIEFRERCEEQNGTISSIDMMSDQQITELFNSENIIVFYTPLGMEIGFNYDGGWATVTYEDYEQYLKVF